MAMNASTLKSAVHDAVDTKDVVRDAVWGALEATGFKSVKANYPDLDHDIKDLSDKISEKLYDHMNTIIDAICEKVIEHIQTFAEVTVTINNATVTTYPQPTPGTGTGTIS